jgi:trans-aconitate methyltransferase
MDEASTLASLLEADGLIGAAGDNQSWVAFVEHVVEELDVGAGTRVWDVGCGSGAFLYPLSLNHYAVGGIDASAERIARARSAMPAGHFTVGSTIEFDPAEPWDVVVASGGLGDCRDLANVRAKLARMAAKATHAIALLGVDEGAVPGVDRATLLRLLSEVGASAVQFEPAAGARLHVLARVTGFSRL